MEGGNEKIGYDEEKGRRQNIEFEKLNVMNKGKNAKKGYHEEKMVKIAYNEEKRTMIRYEEKQTKIGYEEKKDDDGL